MGTETNQLLIGFFVILGVIVVMALIAKYGSAKDDDFVVKEKSGTKNYLIGIYRFYQRIPILKVVFLKIKDAVTKTYPADSLSINKRVSEILFKVTCVVAAGITGTWILAGDDHYFLFMGIIYTLILVFAYINSNLKSFNMKILEQFETFLAKVRKKYHINPQIDDAVYDSVEELDYEIGLHASKIYDIISSPRIDEEIDGYIGTEPNQFVLMFLSMCASIKKFSDKKLPDGTSVFLKNLGYLKDEVHDEIDGLRKKELAFMGLGGIILVPALFCKPLQSYVTSHFEGTEGYYTGIVNIVCLLAIFSITIICYIVLVNLRDGVVITEKETDIFSKLAAKPGISEFLRKVVNKHYGKFRKYNEAAHGMGDHTGMKAFLLKRIVFAIIGFTVSVLVITTGIITSKVNTLNDVATAYDNSMTPSEEYTEAMEELTVKYTHVYKDDKRISADEYRDQIRQDLITDIKANSIVNSETYAEQVADEVINRAIEYRGIYLKWWEAVLALAVGILCFYVPVLYLNFRKRIIEENKNAEIVRFQSIVLILMHMKGTTVDVILEWMERFSYCFKDSIVECRLNLSTGEQKALEEMKMSESHEGFQDFCDCLLAVDKVGVAKAFDAIASDREHYLDDRKTARAIKLDKDSAMASLFFMLPFFTVLVCELLIPFGKFALTLYYQTSSI